MNPYKTTLSLPLSPEDISGMDKLSLKFIHEKRESETQKGKEKTELVKTKTSLLRFFRLRVQGGASDKNLIAFYFAHKDAGAESKVLTQELVNGLCGKAKLKIQKTYSPRNINLTPKELEAAEHFCVQQICDAEVGLKWNSVEKWLQTWIKGDLTKVVQRFAIQYVKSNATARLIEGELPEKIAFAIAKSADLKRR